MKKFLVLSLLISMGSLLAQNSKVEKLDALFSDLYESGRFNGNVLIAENGEILFQKSYGYADFKNQLPLNADTVFDLASVSKEFTAAALLLLQKEGKLNLNDPISNYIPELDFYGTVTLKQLVQHTSGLPLLFPVFIKYWDTNKTAVNQDVAELFALHQPEMSFAPGTDFEYNNANYALMGLIIERVSGKSFNEYLKEHIFEPFEMNNTLVYRRYYDNFVLLNYALGYMPDADGKAMAVDDVPDTDYRHFLDGIVGAGEIKSTVGDLLKWDRALYSNELFDEVDKEILFEGVTLPDGRYIPYGFGWVVREDETFGKIVYHPGRWAGYINHFERDLDKDKTIIILGNNDLPETLIPRNRVRNILYEIEEPKVPLRKLAEYAGEYLNESDEKLTFKKDGSNLYYVRGANDIFRMMPRSDREFTASQYLFDVHFEFFKTKDGKQAVRFSSITDSGEKIYVKE